MAIFLFFFAELAWFFQLEEPTFVLVAPRTKSLLFGSPKRIKRLVTASLLREPHD